MKIHQLNEAPTKEEIKELSDTEWNNIYDVKVWMDDHGFSAIGEGNYSRVYSRTIGDKVIKISKTTDTAYLAFIEYVVHNPNKHFPKVHKLIKYKDGHNDKMFIVILEKLVHSEASVEHSDDDTSRLELLDSGEFSIIEYLQEIGVKFKESDESSLFSAWGEIQHIQDKGGFRIDLVRDNIMRRPSTKDIVFADPLN